MAKKNRLLDLGCNFVLWLYRNQMVTLQKELAMAEHPQHIPERLLQLVVSKAVFEKLGSLGRDFNELVKGMTEADKQESQLMVLEMVRNACGEFYTKMKTRIESKKD